MHRSVRTIGSVAAKTLGDLWAGRRERRGVQPDDKEPLHGISTGNAAHIDVYRPVEVLAVKSIRRPHVVDKRSEKLNSRWLPNNKRSPSPGSRGHSTLSRRQNGGPQEPCASLYNAQNERNSPGDVYACLKTIPFQRLPATQLIQYIKDTLQFQSTLSYLKSPPTSYQQPGIDVMQNLDLIQVQVDTGAFDNEYAFEAALQQVLLRVHDAHVLLVGGLLEFVAFGSPITLSSVSSDGTELPKLYATVDLYRAQDPAAGFTPSPVTKINGQCAEAFLERYAQLNVLGDNDPQADWNDLFDSPAASIQGAVSYLAVVSSFYFSDEITLTFENGTSTPVLEMQGFLDLSGCPTVTNGADVYSCLVYTPPDYSDIADASSAPTDTATGVPQTTAAADTSQITSVTSAIPVADTTSGFSQPWSYSGAFIYGDIVSASTSLVPSVTSNLASDATPVITATPAAVPETPDDSITDWNNGLGYTAYPTDTVVAQPNLGGTGYTTGYVVQLNDSMKIGVLSVPSFDMSGDDVAFFSNTTAEFIAQAQAAQVSKIVIDLQQNFGGVSLLAFDTFRQFFPNIEPFAGSRMRAHPMEDALGNTLTQFGVGIRQSNTSWYEAYLDDPFAITSYKDTATGRDFTSWSEFFGPLPDHGDLFTLVERPDFDDPVFDEVATDGSTDETNGIIPYGYANRRPASSQAPFAAEDIVILTDGLCSSACTLFTEAMMHEAGVPNVVVGGLPQPGPMQGVSGTRGARQFDAISLDGDMAIAAEINASVLDAFPVRDPGIFVDGLTFTLEDQIRAGEFFPLQFAYEAADCRIFYTFANFANYTRLWLDAADALWNIAEGSFAHCVADSTGHANHNVTDTVGPSPAAKTAWRAAGRLNDATCPSALRTAAYPFGLSNANPLLDPDALLDGVTTVQKVGSQAGFASQRSTSQGTRRQQQVQKQRQRQVAIDSAVDRLLFLETQAVRQPQEQAQESRISKAYQSLVDLEATPARVR
ncbi:MAG: hypothetical protein Q9159_000866 [Coniocarpon cinnabarinum]